MVKTALERKGFLHLREILAAAVARMNSERKLRRLDWLTPNEVRHTEREREREEGWEGVDSNVPFV
ncbi:MAG: hypothetical protein GY737_31350 [Desulfobacteraceae bacterium]|nr:hypothetical protein [Desulfobacteraceae bacterium]